MSQVLKNLGPIRLAAVAAVMLGVLGFFVFLISRASTPDMSLLFSQLEPSDAAQIVDKVEAMGYPIEIRGGGTQVFVPQDKVARLRMEMAQSGLPTAGAVGYEIFDRTDTLGVSSALININRTRAMEGELSKSIQSISGIAAARVHLVVPKRELFSRTQSDASASIILKMKGARKLNHKQVQGIQSLVASAVPGLPLEKISIVDHRGNLLAKSNDEGGDPQFFGSQHENRLGYEQNMARTIESLLERSVGVGKVRAEVTVDMDFDRVTINSEEYNPDGQVVRSTTTAEEDSTNSESGGQGVTVENALPDEAGGGGASSGNASKAKRTEETVRYEISKTVKQQVKETGTVKHISVAVLVDGIYEKAEDGKQTYKERSKEELDKFATLVKTAIGYKEDRGDKVEVINMPFSQPDLPEDLGAEESGFLSKLNLNKAIELGVIAIVGLLVLLMVVRPMMLRMMESGQDAAEAIAGSADALGGQSAGALEAPEGGANDNQDEADQRVEVSPIAKISDMIEKNPDEAVTIIRNWMNS